jgi:23S rRNA (adenine2503-C2)-methyltransferase
MKVISPDKKIELIGLTPDELRALFESLGEKPYRARQTYAAMHRRRITDFDRMTELPKTLRRLLEEHAVVTHTKVESVFLSSDGTRRFLMKLEDGREVESVFMPEQRRDTICISSQVGCPLACDFCMTGVIGLKRNMTAGEIVSQVVIVLNEVYGPITELPHGTNIVMMGMGEPLLNYESVMKSIKLFADDEASPRHIAHSRNR